MSVVNLKSTVITNRDAVPKVLTDAAISGGDLKSTQGYVTTGSADSANSTYRLGIIPSNARVEAVKLQCDALGTGCTIDVGVYYPTTVPVGAGLAASLAGTAISAAFFASQVDCHAAVALTDITNQSTSNTIDKQEMPLWQALGLSTDPMIDLDLVATVHVATAASGKIGLKASYAK